MVYWLEFLLIWISGVWVGFGLPAVTISQSTHRWSLDRDQAVQKQTYFNFFKV